MHAIIKQDIRRISRQIKKEAKVLEGRTLLISGGAGFIGRYIVATIEELNRKVFSLPCRVISIDNYITGKKMETDVTSVTVTHLERDVIKPVFIKGSVDYIIHAAGLASPVYYKKFPLQTIESAIFGAKNLLELARTKRVKSFLFFSSSEIYGDPDPNFIPTPETYRGNVSSTGPRACYDESKRLGETLCMTYYHVYRVPVKIVRPFNVYGPGIRLDDYRVIPSFLTSAILQKPLPVHDEGNQTRTFCYIADAVTAFFKVLLSSSNGQVYNVGNDKNEMNMMGLAQLVRDISGKNVEIKKVAYPAKYPQGEPKRRCPDLTKIRTQLGYVPEVDLQEGLKRTLRWFRSEFKKSSQRS